MKNKTTRRGLTQEVVNKKRTCPEEFGSPQGLRPFHVCRSNKEKALCHNGGRMGFTLIELLVVVLIIGILAAVALPQYQKAVAKSRFAALKPIAQSIKDAEEIYYNEHGIYGELADLDVQAPEESVTLSETSGHDYVRAGSSSGNRYTVYFNHSENFAGNVYCEAEQNNAVANAVCVSEQGVDSELVQDGHKLYLMSGNSTGEFGIRYTVSSCGSNCSRYRISENEYIEITPKSSFAWEVGGAYEGKEYRCEVWSPSNGHATVRGGGNCRGASYEGFFSDLCIPYPFLCED